MSKHSDYVRAIGFNLYRDQWVLASAQKVKGAGTLDAPPVRLIKHADQPKLLAVVKELFSEDVPVVPEPDRNDADAKVGIRARALGLKSWRAFVEDARCFNLELYEDKLILEEWPREGASFTANASWRKEFPSEALEQAVDYLLRNTRPVSHNRKGLSNKRRLDRAKRT